MKIIKQFLLPLILSTLFCQQANALDILFPQSNPYKTWSQTTYIMGNVKKGAELKVNGENTKVWNNGAYCHIISLPEGDNEYTLTETYEDENGNTVTNEKILKIKKLGASKKISQTPVSPDVPKRIYNQKQPQYTTYEKPKFAYIITDGAPARSYPSTNGERISHLPQKTVVILDGEFKNWYKIQTKAEPLWVYKNNVKVLYPLENDLLITIRRADIFQDEDFSYLQMTLDIPVPYKITENGNDIELTIWGIYDIYELNKVLKKQKRQNWKIKSYENNILTLLTTCEDGIWGYDATYDNYTLVLKKRKYPIIYSNSPLKNMTIAVDAGHGGREAGTVGPTRIPEKVVNLAISKQLQTELEKRGAKVVMTRTEDKDVEIYSRPQIANENNATISISIHANSMVDGNPLERNGVSVFWYNDHAKDLADTIKKTMVEQLKLRDDGTRYSSFVLTRPTMPVSVLVEVGYMPNPDEYLKLTNPKFQRQAAKAIADGVEKFLKAKAKNKTIEIEESKVFLPILNKGQKRL